MDNYSLLICSEAYIAYKALVFYASIISHENEWFKFTTTPNKCLEDEESLQMIYEFNLWVDLMSSRKVTNHISM